VSSHLKAITHGNLTTVPRPWGRDEAADLMLDLGAMQRALRQVVSTVLDGSSQVRTASHEISTATNDLSRRSEQAAANLQQTAARTDEISSTVRQTTHTVQSAKEIVNTNAEAAQRGGQVIENVVATMEGIRTASGRIGEIIGVIDGIAFQTNILALNAAVEAARAGEQGRGFAVVAGEVRALASRSAGAAREIKDLIQDSLHPVEAGARVVAEAGQTMTTIVENAHKITGLMDQIDSATQEQSVSVEQVGSVVQELDRSTQQNAALVEQTAAATQALSDQATRLAQEVGFFKIPATP
jgi:methyl-accepting chemotaxis protein